MEPNQPHINFCYVCGAKLRRAKARGEPLNEYDHNYAPKADYSHVFVRELEDGEREVKEAREELWRKEVAEETERRMALNDIEQEEMVRAEETPNFRRQRRNR